MTTHIVYGDVHTQPGKSNERATWLGKLIKDIKPDIVVNLGDNADMSSLCSYDKGTASAIGRTYQADIDAHLDFEERLWFEVKKPKKKIPKRYFLVGNHEQRISRALEVQPILKETIGYKDLKLEDNYDEVVYYNGTTPGSINLDGITYAHFFVTGVSGKPISSSNSASLSLSKYFGSTTQGHSHTLDYASKPTINNKRIHSLIAGCFSDAKLEWAGEMNKLWWKGCFIKTQVEDGNYDLQIVSLEQLRKEYSG